MSTHLDHICYGFLQLLFEDIFNPQNDKVNIVMENISFARRVFFGFIDLRKGLSL